MRIHWVATALLGLSSAAHAAAQPMSFDEVMRQQRMVDSASFAPGGRKLLYAIRRYDAGTSGLMVPVGSREAWILDLDSGRRVRIGGPEGGGYLPTACGAWAPDGHGVALITERGGLPRVGFYDVDHRRFTLFSPQPAGTCLTWVGGTIVYPAPTPQAPTTWSNRQRLASEAARWDATWSGRSAEVTVHSGNPAFPTPRSREAGLAYADPASGRSGLVAHGDFIALTPSPDGRTLAVIRLGAVDPEAINSQKGRTGQLELYRIGPGGGRRLFGLSGYDVGEGGLAWSPDGRRLLVGAKAPGQRTPGLFILDVASQAVEPVRIPKDTRLAPVDPGAIERFQQIGWIAGEPAFVARAPGSKTLSSDARSDYGGGQGLAAQVYVASHGTAHALTDFATQSVTHFATTADGDGLVVADGALWRVRPDAPPRRITPQTLNVIGLATASQGAGAFQPAVHGQDVAISAKGRDGRGRLMTINIKTGGVLTDAPANGFAAWSPELTSGAVVRHVGWSSELGIVGAGARSAVILNPAWRDRPLGEVRAISYEVGGRSLGGWVVTPPGYAGGRLPAIVWIYGGQLLRDEPPLEATPGIAPTPVFDGQLWAAGGYVVIYPSTPIAPGAETDVAATLAEEAVAAVDAAAQQGWVDPGRVAIMGHSFGGFSTAAVLARRSDRFRAGVAMSGVYDFAAGWATRFPSDRMVDARGGDFSLETRGYVEQGQIGLEAPPWAAVTAYVRSSPLYSVETIRTPLLLTVGDLDLGITDLFQSERFYAALRRAGNPAVLVRYWGEGHVRSDGAAARDEWRRVSTWLAHYLKGEGAAPPLSPAGGSASSAPRLPQTQPTARPSAGPRG